MAEIQADSGNRLLPLPLMPAWNIDACVAEAQAGRRARCSRREHDLRSRGPRRARPRQPRVGPVLGGVRGAGAAGALPHRCERHGDDVLRQVPVGVARRRTPSCAIGGTLLFIGNARVVVNVILSGMFDRHPDAEDRLGRERVGWIPFILEALDYEMGENAPTELARLAKPPSEYFQQQHLRDVLVRAQRRQPAAAHRGRRRGQHPVRDRLPAPDVPVPRPAPDGRGQDGDAVAGHPAQDPRRERPGALPDLSACHR